MIFDFDFSECDSIGWLKKLYEMAEAFDVPIYDTDRNEIWAP